MIRKLVLVSLWLLSASIGVAAQPVSTPPPAYCYAPTASDPTFCATFPPVAECNCKLTPGATPNYCSSMSNIYSGMMTRYHHSLHEACDDQKITDTLECEADWTCYWSGGISLKDGLPCNGTGQACTTQKPPK